MTSHPQVTPRQPHRSCYLRFLGSCSDIAGGAAVCLSDTEGADPFVVTHARLPDDAVTQKAQFEALILGLLECLRHHVYHVHIFGYKASDAINPVRQSTVHVF